MSLPLRCHCLLSLLIWLSLPAFPVLADPPAVDNGKADNSRMPLSGWQKSLEAIEKELELPDTSDDRLVLLRDQLLELEKDLRASQNAANDEAAVTQHDLDALGPLPARGAAAEAPHLAARRKQLGEQLASASDIVKEGDLLLGRAGRGLKSIKDLRRTRFTERVLTRTRSPLHYSSWEKAFPEWQALWKAGSDPLRSWLTQPSISLADPLSALPVRLGIGGLLGLVLIFPIRRALVGQLLVDEAVAMSDRFRRWRDFFVDGLLYAVLPTLGALTLYLAVIAGNSLSQGAVTLAWEAWGAVALASVAISLARAMFRPDHATLRMVDWPDAAARAMFCVVSLLAMVFAADHVLDVFLDQQDVSVEVIQTRNVVFSLLVSLILIRLVRPGLWDAREPGSRPRRVLLQRVVLILIGFIVITSFIGYLALSQLAASHVVLSLGLLTLLRLLLPMCDDLAAMVVSGETWSGRYVRQHWVASEEGVQILDFWIGTILKLGFAGLGVLALLVLWSIDDKDFLLSVWGVFEGVRIGKLTISPAQVLFGLALFGVLIKLTQMIRRVLNQRIFPRMGLETGMRHSISSAVGYAGFTLASVLGISSMGIDLSNLAIIAGALSVGIGFGLQNIVNNFVSGLILLFERPINVGDLVAIGEHRGQVRKISVRATELRTLDNATVFIPHSSLISGALMNRTRADKTGRLSIPLEIDPGADPGLIRQAVLKLAESHPEVCREPVPPAVLMVGFDDLAVYLELVALARDGERVQVVTSELCFSIFRELGQSGVRIPGARSEIRASLVGELSGRTLAEPLAVIASEE